MNPSSTVLARMPLRPSSLAMVLTSTSMAALGAADNTSALGGRLNAQVLKASKVPPPWRRKTCSAVLNRLKQPLTSMANTSAHTLGVSLDTYAISKAGPAA